MALFILMLVQLLSISLPSIMGIRYEVINGVPNTLGGNRFEKEIGAPFAKQVMRNITLFIWDTFQQYNESDKRETEVVKMFFQEIPPEDEGITVSNMVNVSAVYFGRYNGNDIRREFTSLLHHEITHVFQWFGILEDGSNPEPSGLVEGIADYMMLKGNYPPVDLIKPGVGKKWDEGYEVTARFLEYCEGLKSGFVAGINRMMRTHYSDHFFIELLGKPVDQLWHEYKAKYGFIV